MPKKINFPIHNGPKKVRGRINKTLGNNELRDYLASKRETSKSKFLDTNGNLKPIYDIGESGYSGWTNELFTEYKIIKSGAVENPDINEYKEKPRTINYQADPTKAYTIERKITRESNLTDDNPASWEIIESAATFPYEDSEIFKDHVTKNLDFEIRATYDVVPTGTAENNDTPEQDFFEIDLIEDWGKSEKNDYTFSQESQDFSFKSGEAIRVTQKGFSNYIPPNVILGTPETHNILGAVEIAFSPSMTGISGSVTGENNYKNFYEFRAFLI